MLIPKDQMKSTAQIHRDRDKKCIICQKPITKFKGVGANKLCREHQIEERNWGGEGMGRIDRPHTFHRKFECDECHTNILEDKRLDKITDKEVKFRIARTLIHGDHIIRRADGGDDSAENIRSLCYVCHSIKTISEKDYLKKNLKLTQE